jgi:prevent-host-death family protein
MTQVNIHEAKTQLSKLIEKVKKGEEVIISKYNKPVVKLVLIEELKSKRRLNTAKGLIVMSEDFDSPLEDLEDYIN